MSRSKYGPEQFQSDTGVSRETLKRFEIWLDMLEATSTHTNLVGRKTLEDFWHRHALDSWQVFDVMPNARRWADLGAGAGFPGLAIAFGLMERHPESAHVIMIDSVAKKMAFVNSVITATKAPAITHTDRVESLKVYPEVDVVTARAMAPLTTLLGYVHPFVEKGALALLPKGARHNEELTQARKSWTFDVEALPSRTAPEAAILKIRGLARV